MWTNISRYNWLILERFSLSQIWRDPQVDLACMKHFHPSVYDTTIEFQFLFKMSVYDARLLPRLTGTTVTTYDDPSPDVSPILPRRIPHPPSTHSASVDRSPSPAPTTHSAYIDPSAATEDTWTWVITKKLSEEVAPMTKSDVEEGSGVPHTVGKFECHLQGQPNRQAFMRIYWQIPIVGTEDDDARTVAQQAVPPPVCGELESFRLLKGCSAVPRFYGHAEKTQGERDLVPGGYIQYVVWEKVPGVSLTKEFFWGLDFSTRHEIREKFRAVFQ